jgi:hypothetical protein
MGWHCWRYRDEPDARSAADGNLPDDAPAATRRRGKKMDEEEGVIVVIEEGDSPTELVEALIYDAEGKLVGAEGEQGEECDKLSGKQGAAQGE